MNRVMKILVFMILLLTSTFSWAQDIVEVKATIRPSTNKNMINYSKKRSLKYYDFKGPVKHIPNVVAMVYSGVYLAMEPYTVGDQEKVYVFIEVYMDPSLSWMKKEGRDKRVLNHENKHFDLTAIAACRLLKEINQYQFTKNWRAELKEIYYNEVESKLQRIQNIYDSDTKHGTNENAQKAYDAFIEKQIKDLDCFNPA